MNQNPFPGQYATPSALGVKPDARLQTAFLTQAFVWMFAGLLVTAGVAAVVQSNQQLLDFAAGSFFILFIVQLAIVIGISAAINRISATLALGLFFIYAASLGITIGLIVTAYTGDLIFLQRPQHFRLGRQTHISDLIQENRTSFRQLKFSDPLPDSGSK